VSAATLVEEVLTLRCGADVMPGIATRPSTIDSDLGVIIVVGGPQYRAGSHRQFVHWARAMASSGLPVLRFDVRGMGDASGTQRAFTELDDDIRAAIDAFTAGGPVRRVVLAGLCDGASATLLYLHSRRDPRVSGVVLLNPWVRSAESEQRTVVRHYYLRRATERGFWIKLLRGRVSRSALTEAFGRVYAQLVARPGTPAADEPESMSYQERMARALADLRGPALVVLSGEDFTAREFADLAAADPAWQRALAQPQVRRIDLPGADHTFSSSVHRQQLEAATVKWLAEACARC
jgi:exosortase A-associated hydrolase 1